MTVFKERQVAVDGKKETLTVAQSHRRNPLDHNTSNLWKIGLNKERFTLQQTVVAALDQYLEDLDGEAPCNLYEKVISEIEKPLIETIMNYCGHNQSKAASCLGINRGTLRKKLKQYEISP